MSIAQAIFIYTFSFQNKKKIHDTFIDGSIVDVRIERS
jgi:hypothetical protein